MPLKTAALESRLTALDAAVRTAWALCPAPVACAIDRLGADVAAVIFHLSRDAKSPSILAVIGGTGTGKSTLINRLLNREMTAASFRRTFTAGAIALARSNAISQDWLKIEHAIVPSAQLPTRGRGDALTVVEDDQELLSHVTLIDTPDLDGDQPEHHAQADRVFRWADAVLMLVTPEKYQMTELFPYYRLIDRYGIPALFVMNKAEQQEAVDDYSKRVGKTVFVIPRDDAPFQPPHDQDIEGLRRAISGIQLPEQEARERGIHNRIGDLLGRLNDQVLDPMQSSRKAVDQTTASLRSMETPAPGVDASPLLVQLQRRLQQRSVLYLIGPGKVLDRVRQVPQLLMRLPRNAWDLLRRGEKLANGEDGPPDLSKRTPDFESALSDQLKVLQSRIDDVIRESPILAPRIDEAVSNYSETKLSSEQASAIAIEEIAELKNWLETRWNASPRDTAMIEKLIQFLPGGRSLAKWSEAAPYLLAVIVATHHAFFGPVDLMILGGYSVAAWLTERVSNEVTWRARQANQNIAERFEKLAHRQIEQTCSWLETLAPTTRTIRKVRDLVTEIQELDDHAN